MPSYGSGIVIILHQTFPRSTTHSNTCMIEIKKNEEGDHRGNGEENWRVREGERERDREKEVFVGTENER